MGANASVLVNPEKDGHVTDDKVREQLEVLLKLADARLDAYQSELEMMFVDNASAAKRTVPGKRALRFARYVGVDIGSQKNKVKEAASSLDANGVDASSQKKPDPTTTGNEVDDVVCGFFNITPKAWLQNEDDFKKNNIQNTPQFKRVSAIRGFAKVVSNGLKDILVENTSAGESTEKKFFVCIHHNAVIRIDVMTYRYNFNKTTNSETSKDVTFVGNTERYYENIFGYVYCLSVVDHREVTDDEIIFLASEFAGDNLSEFGEYLDQLIAVWAKLRSGSPITTAATR